MEDKIIQFKPRAAKAAKAVEQPAERLFWMDHEVAELTLTIPQSAPQPPRVRY